MPVSADARRAISRAVAACELLEPRRLLAVMLDPTFGGGDGQTLQQSPFDFFDTSGGGDVQNPVVPHVMGRLDGKYFTVGSHEVLAELGGATISAETVQALLNDDGSPSGNLDKDTDNDGLAFYTREEQFSGAFSGPGNYHDLVSLPDGSALGLVGSPEEELDTRVVQVFPDGTENSFFEISDVGEIQAIEMLTPALGVLLSKVLVEDAQPPFQPVDFFYQVQVFDLVSGELLGDPVLPFGEWLHGDQFLDVPTLHVGRDGNTYVSTLTTDLDEDVDPTDSGFLIARLRRFGQELRVDNAFGTLDLPTQETPAVYMASPGPASNQAFELIGSTTDRRVWVRVADSGGEQAKLYALLTEAGALDPAFGTAGIVDLGSFLGDPDQAVHESSPIFTSSYGAATTTPRPFVRGDGSIAGIYSVPTGTSLPAGTVEFVVGVFGLMADGSFDQRIAEAGTPFGVGRALVAADVDRVPGTDVTQHEAVAFMDAQERLLIASQIRRTDFPGDQENVPVYLLTSRIITGVPRVDTVDRPDGTRVLEIEGTTGNDRYILRAGTGTFRLFGQSEGAAESQIGEFDATDIDRVEMMGGEGDDGLFSELGEAFGGFVTLFGGNGSDILSSDGRYTRIFGEVGDDTLLGGLGDQLIFGGAGNDSLLGGSGRDALFGEEGDDVLRGQLGGDLLDGGAGNDTLAGDEDNDTLVGGDGDDSMLGGSGIDLASYAGRSEDLSLRLGSDDNGPLAGFEADFIDADVENALGGTGNDSIAGSDGRNFLLGGNGNDTLLGLDGKDTLLGGGGSDLMDGGDDFDLLIDDDAIPANPPFPTIRSPDTLIGGGGFDVGLRGGDEDTLEAEKPFETLEELLSFLNGEG